jgi:hypothetical protein
MGGANGRGGARRRSGEQTRRYIVLKKSSREKDIKYSAMIKLNGSWKRTISYSLLKVGSLYF